MSFKMPSDVNRIIRAFADRASPYICPPGRTMFKHTINPTPPPPVIKVIMMYGPDEYTTSSIAQRLAADLGGYHHLNIREVLKYVDQLPEDNPYKKKALCNLDPYTFEDLMDKGRFPPEMLLAEIMRVQIDDRVALGHRKFVICGMPDEPRTLWHFSRKTAEPNAIICLGGPLAPAWYQQLADEYKYKDNNKVLIVPDWPAEETYKNVLFALATRVQASVKKNPPVYQGANPQKHDDRKNADIATLALPDDKIERIDTPVQIAADEDLLDNLESALNSAPDR